MGREGTLNWINKNNEVFFVKSHFHGKNGIKNLSADQAVKMKSINPDYAVQDLLNHITRGKLTLNVQVMPGCLTMNEIFLIIEVCSYRDYQLIQSR